MRRFLLLFLALCPLTAYAQNASVGGAVQDPSGAVIIKAAVEFRNQDTGIRRHSASNGDGYYQIDGIDPGKYDAMVEASGFKTITREGVVFHVGDKLRLDFKMQVGESTERVEVDGSGQQINRTDASVSTVIDRKFVENMPLNGRSFQDLISMTPGVVTQNPQSSTAAGSGDFSVNGQRTESNYYVIDGVSGNISAGAGSGFPQAANSGSLQASTALGTTQSLMSTDALQEFRVQSSTYSAEYGRSPGGQFSFVTRSGTNAIHGSAFDYLRNNFFDANDWFNDHYSKPTAPLRQNDFGGTVGGPISVPRIYNGKDRSFFFVTYEGLRLTQPQAATIQYVPNTYIRQNAPAVMQTILNAFPKQTANGIDYGNGLAQFITSYPLPSKIDSTSARVDYAAKPWLSLFFRVADTPSSAETRSLSALTNQAVNTQTYTAGATSKISSKLDNEFRLGYARSDSNLFTNLDSFGGAVPIDLTASLGVMGYPNAWPQFSLLVPSLGSSILKSPRSFSHGRQWNVVDTVNLSSGKHQLRLGIDYRRVKSTMNRASPFISALYLSQQAIISNSAYLVSLQKVNPAEPIFNEFAAFVQDQWQITPRLSLSTGLRWEVDPPPTEAHGNNAYTLLGDVNQPNTLTVAPHGTPLWHTSWYNFAPRLGAAWQANTTPGRETVIRAGGGAFFDSDGRLATYGFSGLGFQALQYLFNASLPLSKSALDFEPSTVAPYTSTVIYAFPQHLQLPYTLEWNVSAEQALGEKQSFTLSYVGSNGRRLLQIQERTVTSANPNFGSIYYMPGGVTSNYQALQVKFQRSVSKGLQALASYTWSHSLDLGSQDSASPLTRGNSDFDVRNNVSAGVSWELPQTHVNRLIGATLNGWGVDARVLARTAFPITIQGNYLTDPATGEQYYGNADLVANQPIYISGSQFPGGRKVNSSAFSLPASSGIGNAPRNFVRGFGATQANLAARREFRLHDSVSLQFRAEAFNLFNHPNFGYVDPTLTNATFGQALKMLNQSLGTLAAQYQQGGPRSMQFALKLKF